MDQLSIFTLNVVKQWEFITVQATRLLDHLTDDSLSKQVAPGRNNGKYIIGHLIAINDAIPHVLGIGEARYPELMDVYVRQPYGVAEYPQSFEDLRHYWKETHTRITALIKVLTVEDWMAKHNLITDEEFRIDPLRNRLSILINRTNHFYYHVGQLRLIKTEHGANDLHK